MSTLYSGEAMQGPAADVFLSYKAEDRARLVPLVAALEAEGFTVWWDAHIGSGTNWHKDIEQHLESAKCVLVAWSKRSVGDEGHFVRDEARRAQRRGAYIPVRLDTVEPPLGFGEIQATSLKGWKGDRADPRFRTVVGALQEHVSGEHISHAHEHVHQPRVSRRVVMAGGAGVAAVTAAGGGWFLLKPAAANAARIAVMPFANLSGDPGQAYFAEGVAEELRGALSRIGLEVIGRASSEAVKDMDIRSAAAKLGVANILTGSVRRSPQTVRVSAQLVDGSEGVERWGQSYDNAPGDEIKIQTDIATSVAQALSVALGQARKAALTLGDTTDAAAQDLYLRARDLMTKVADREAYGKAVELLKAAIVRDPNYARAYVGKARVLFVLGSDFPTSPGDRADKYAQGESAGRQAIAITPRLGSAYVSLALIDSARFSFVTAVENMRKGLELSPDDPSVLSPASNFILFFGDPHKALELVDRQIALDPLQAILHGQRAGVLFCLRDYLQSIAANRKALALAPKLTFLHASIADCLALMNRTDEAKTEYAKASIDEPARLVGEAILAARMRNLAEVERIVTRMREQFGDAASAQYALIQAQAGNADGAFAELEKAVHVKDPGLLTIRVNPGYDPIRRDPRFPALLKRLDFPTWS